MIPDYWNGFVFLLRINEKHFFSSGISTYEGTEKGGQPPRAEDHLHESLMMRCYRMLTVEVSLVSTENREAENALANLPKYGCKTDFGLTHAKQ